MPPAGATSSSRDVVIVGDGIVGLTLAAALSRRHVASLIVGTPRPGAASGAAAGLLAPSVSPAADPAVRVFMVAARDAYPEFVAWLSSTSGRNVPLGPRGILEIAPRAADFQALLAGKGREAMPLDARVVMEMEPALAPVAGALFHPADGVVDVGALMSALGTAAERDPRIELRRAEAAGIEAAGRDAAVVTSDGSRLSAGTVVIAAGAWASRLVGLPRPLPIEPARGQILPLAASPLRHAVVGPGGYLIPRAGRTLVGSTLEHVGFDAGTTPAALDQLARLASTFAPELGRAPKQPGWAGLRPVTPDMLPILGRDPEHSALLYSCGHSKNGILTAPLAAECLAALIAGDRSPHDLAPFAISRFAPRRMSASQERQK